MTRTCKTPFVAVGEGWKDAPLIHTRRLWNPGAFWRGDGERCTTIEWTKRFPAFLKFRNGNGEPFIQTQKNSREGHLTVTSDTRRQRQINSIQKPGTMGISCFIWEVPAGGAHGWVLVICPAILSRSLRPVRVMLLPPLVSFSTTLMPSSCFRMWRAMAPELRQKWEGFVPLFLLPP